LIEKYLDEGQNLEEAIYSTTQKLKGAYALAIMFVDEPNKIIGIRKESPLIVGKGNGENFLTSDVSAILSHTDQVIYLDNMEMAILDGNGVTIKNLDGDSITKEIHTIEWSAEMAEKQGFDHFMLKEIHEQPNAVKQTLMEADEINNIIKKFPKFNKISFVACGTSYHASLVGKYLFETLTGVPTDVILASEFEYSASTLNENTLVILISQSGETADTLKALRIANKKSHTLVIVNVVGSTATREADDVIITRAGPEIGVAATKTYVSQLTVIYLMAILMGGNDDLLKTLENMPDYMEEALKTEDQIKEIAGKYSKKTDFFFIGRGYSYPTAIEGALKLKEITYIHAEGYAAGELKHGPLALIDDDVPVVAVIPPGISRDKTLSNMEEVKARNAHVIALGSSADETLKSESDEFIGLPNEINEMFSPLPYVIPMQLLSYYISVERGLDPDKPKNLAKCVTVE
jgi:glucosamine--fructose-6-phosphate aminotransferase (isomerizing)